VPWVKLSDDFPEHPAVVEAGLDGAGFFVAALCHSNRYLTEGYFSATVARRLEPSDKKRREIIKRLVRLGLIAECERDGVAGFQLHRRYVADQPTRAEVEKRKADSKVRKEKYNLRHPAERENDASRVGAERAENASGTAFFGSFERDRNASQTG
jgi:hypothetical protein